MYVYEGHCQTECGFGNSLNGRQIPTIDLVGKNVRVLTHKVLVKTDILTTITIIPRSVESEIHEGYCKTEVGFRYNLYGRHLSWLIQSEKVGGVSRQNFSSYTHTHVRSIRLTRTWLAGRVPWMQAMWLSQ